MIKFEKVSKEIISQFISEQDLEYFTNEMPIPKRKTGLAAGYDFVSPISVTINPGESSLIPTGIRAAMEEDMVLKLYIRSSLSKKLFLANSVGVIDSDYYMNPGNEGLIFVELVNRINEPVTIERGDRIIQGIFEKFYLVDGDEIGKGEERTGGYGSTGTK